jgi:hypothetical protein
MAKVRCGSDPMALYVGRILEYTGLMSKNKVTFPKPFNLQFEMALEGVANVWEAHSLICTEAQLECADVHNVEYIGQTSNAWPIISVTFSNLECAKVYTAVYLGLGIDPWTIDTDEEVGEYISGGVFAAA